MGRVERSKLKVGEAVYAKFDEGDWQVIWPRKRKWRSARTPINTMNFRLEKVSATKALVKFHIKNSAGETCGSVSVPPSQVDDLLASWHGPQAAPSAKPAADKAARGKAATCGRFKAGTAA